MALASERFFYQMGCQNMEKIVKKAVPPLSRRQITIYLPNFQESERSPAMERVYRTMGLHPKYLEAFENVHQHLLTGSGPLMISDRYYIGLMVRCSSFLPSGKKVATLFTRKSGNPEKNVHFDFPFPFWQKCELWASFCGVIKVLKICINAPLCLSKTCIH